MDSFLSLLQFADGLFPAGAYAHSFRPLPPMRLPSCVLHAREKQEILPRAFPWMKHSMR